MTESAGSSRVARDATQDRGRAGRASLLEGGEGGGCAGGRAARGHGTDGRSLNAWRMNLARPSARDTSAVPRLVELVPAPTTRNEARYLVRVGELAIEVGADFEDATDRQGALVRRLRLVRAREASRGGKLPAPAPRDRGNRVRMDGAAFASLLAGIDFTASRKGWFRRLPEPYRIDSDRESCSRRWVPVDIEAMRRTDAAQREQIAQLLSTNASLLSTQAALVAEVAKLNDRVAELLTIARRKQRKTATRAAPKEPETPPVVGEDAQKAFHARPAPPSLPNKTRAPKSPRGARDATRTRGQRHR